MIDKGKAVADLTITGLATVHAMNDRERRVVSDMNTPYLSAGARADIERLGIELSDGVPLTVCDYDGTEDEPLWLVVEGTAQFDSQRQAWMIGYTMDDRHWEPREP